MSTPVWRSERTKPWRLVWLLAALLALSGCGTGAPASEAGSLPVTRGSTPSYPPTLDPARLATIAAQRPGGSPVLPASLLPPITGSPCLLPGTGLATVTAVPAPSPGRTGTLTSGVVSDVFPGPCVDREYAQPLAFALDGRTLAIGGAATVALYDPLSRRALWVLPTPARPTAIAFAPDGTRLAIGLADGRVLLCRAVDGTVSQILDRPGRVYGSQDWYIAAGPITFSPDGLFLAGGYVGLVAVWPLAAGGEPHILGLNVSIIEALAFDAGGEYLRAVLPGSLSSNPSPNIHRWSTGDWRLVDSWTVPVKGATCLTTTGTTLVTATETGIAAWVLSAAPPTRGDIPVPGPYSATTSMEQLACSPRGDIVAGVTSAAHIYLWDATSRTVVVSYTGREVSATGVTLTADGATVAVVYSDGMVSLWQR